MSIIEQIKAKAREKFPEYSEAVARVQRAEAAQEAANAELKAAREQLAKYGDKPDCIRWVIRELTDVFGEDASPGTQPNAATSAGSSPAAARRSASPA